MRRRRPVDRLQRLTPRIWTRYDFEIIFGHGGQGLGEALGIHEFHLISREASSVGVLRVVHDDSTRRSG
jgi:hypothetical protein